jgi:hypothetical protein
MKKLAFLILLTAAAVISGCGSNTIQPLPTTNTTGNWEAQLIGGTGPATQLNFMVTFNVFITNGQASQSLNIQYLTFYNSSPDSCFQAPTGTSTNGSPVSVLGSMDLFTNTGTEQISGTMTMTIKSSSGNVLTLTANPPSGGVLGTNSNGNMTKGAVTGTWTLTSSNKACAVNNTPPATFIMCQNATSCSTT